LLISSKSLS